MSFKLNTPGAYLVKDGEKQKIGDRYYDAEEINGWCSPSHRILVTDMDTGKKQSYFPGQAMFYHPPTDNSLMVELLTKDEIRALMSDKVFPKNITKLKLLEAYYGQSR